LIFGYKQRGQEAVDAHNVFFYLTYAGVVDIDSIEDEVQRSSIESQIINFGQTPLQLFTKPHARRCTLADVMPARSNFPALVSSGPSPSQYAQIQALGNLSSAQVGASAGPLSASGSTEAWSQPPAPWCASEIPCKSVSAPIHFVQQLADRVIFVAGDGTLANSQLSTKTKYDASGMSLPFTFDLDKTLGGKSQKNIDIVMSDSIVNHGACYALTPDGKYVICCGSWDDSVTFYQVASGKAQARIVHHIDTVTALAMSPMTGGGGGSSAAGMIGGSSGNSGADLGFGTLASVTNAVDSFILVTASRDCTLAIWDVTSSLLSPTSSALDFLSARGWSRKKRRAFELRASMHTHDGPITCVAVNAELDLVLSGSVDRSVVLHNASYGQYIRSVYFPYPVDQVQLSRDGRFVVYCSGNRMLYLHTINGQMVAQVRSTLAQLYAIRLTHDGRYCVTAGVGDVIIVQDVHARLDVVRVFELPDPSDPVRSLEFILNDHFLLAGTTSGRLLVFPFQPYQWY
jgi:WD40 repeat protein